MNDVMVVGGLFDNLLKSLLQWPDFSKVNHDLLKDGIGKSFDSLKPAVGSLGGMLIDAVKAALGEVIDNMKVKLPLVVGASQQVVAQAVITASQRRSREEVEKAILDKGGDPTMFAPWIILILQILPGFLELIDKLFGK